MRDVYEVLRQKELEVSRLEKEVAALRVSAPLLADDEAGNDKKPTSPPAVNDTQQQARVGWGDRAKKLWP